MLSAFSAAAQSSSTLMGARATGLGYASSCISDEWSLFNNVGGLAAIKNTTCAVAYNSHPGFPSFDRAAAAISMPVFNGAAALGVFHFGDDLYNEQILSGGFSNQFGLASLGLKIDYIQYNAEGFGRRGVVTFSFGGIAKLTPQLSCGAHITNINQPELSRATGETTPTRINAGMAFLPGEKVSITAEIEKDLDHELIIKSGVEYQFQKKFFFRTGFNLQPSSAFFGVGFKPKKMAIDYGMQHDFNLGFNHHVSVSYKLKSK
jgi:hypothetical protein